ncbi:MAG: hypothetical protein Q7R65_04315, partial [bacterium]|nr:hypothetical protein [bacterium]
MKKTYFTKYKVLFWVTLLVLSFVTVVNAASPVISTITVSGISTSTAIISWNTGTEKYYTVHGDDPSGDLVEYKRSGGYRVWPLIGSSGRTAEIGADKKLYIGMCGGGGHLYQLDPRDGTLNDLGQIIPGTSCVMSLSLGPDGFIYGGTYTTADHAYLFQLDTRGPVPIMTRKVLVDPTEKYNSDVVAAPDGWVYSGIGVVKSNIVAYNPATGELRGLMLDSERTTGTAHLIRGIDNNAYGINNKKNYRLLNGTATLLTDRPPATMPRNRWSDGTIANPTLYPGRERLVFLVSTGPDGLIYFNGTIPEYIARFDPATGQTIKLGEIFNGAEAYSKLAAYGKLFIASYPHSLLHIYDPTRPFNSSPGLTKTDNPAYYGFTAPNQDRPRAMIKGANGRIYIADHPTYGFLGGAISWYDPATDSTGFVPTPVPNQSLWSLANLPGGLIAIGTDIDGGPGTIPTATQTKLCVWDYNDPTRCQWEGAPLRPGNTGIKSLTLGGDNLLYGAGGSQVFAFNPVTRTILATTTSPQGAAVLHRAGLMTLADGRVVALTKNSATFIKYNKSTPGGTWTFKTFAKSTLLTSGGAIMGNYLYAASNKALVRVRIPSATATTVANFEKVGSVSLPGETHPNSNIVVPGSGVLANSQVEYGLTTSFGLSTPIAPALVTAHSIRLTSLTPNTLYHYRVKSKDVSGNLATSVDGTFRTTALGDTTPPVISAINATSLATSSATILWTTNEPATAQVQYGLTSSYGSATLERATLLTSQ